MFKVYGDANDDVYLKLEKIGNGVSLVTVNGNGEKYDGGFVLTITPDGRLVKHFCIKDELGFQCDERGRIKEKARV